MSFDPFLLSTRGQMERPSISVTRVLLSGIPARSSKVGAMSMVSTGTSTL